MGPGPEDGKDATVLNRVLRWTEAGLEYKADPRQGEKLVEELKLGGANSCVTPGVKTSQQQLATKKESPNDEHTAFRGMAARPNYLAADRPDVQFACKEVCRHMAKPTNLAQEALKRVGSFLIGRPRLVWLYPFQEAGRLDVYSDTDWGGCSRTRKSTSGGAWCSARMSGRPGLRPRHR